MGKIFGHNFRPVITLGSPTITDINLHPHAASHTSKIIDATKSETFHGVFCSRCGISGKDVAAEPQQMPADARAFVVRVYRDHIKDDTSPFMALQYAKDAAEIMKKLGGGKW